MSADGSIVRFADQTEIDVTGVVWATGFRVDHAWVDLPIFDDGGRLKHQRGVTEAPGLYFLGLSWQYTRGSALLGWVKDDAGHIADKVAAFRPAASSQPALTTSN